MRFVVVFLSGVAVGYTLHIKKDQTIDSVATGAIEFLENRTSAMRKRLLTTD